MDRELELVWSLARCYTWSDGKSADKVIAEWAMHNTAEEAVFGQLLRSAQGA